MRYFRRCENGASFGLFFHMYCLRNFPRNRRIFCPRKRRMFCLRIRRMFCLRIRRILDAPNWPSPKRRIFLMGKYSRG